MTFGNAVLVADASGVDAALLARLASDATLAAMMPDGVYFDIAAPGSTAFVIVSLMAHETEYQLQQETAWEIYTYMVKAVTIGTSGLSAKAAADRIHELLQNAELHPDGYYDMRCQRTERLRNTEVDEASDARWQHRGGLYEIWVAEDN